jgi:tetratricopeptide (TPR) repeat protein
MTLEMAKNLIARKDFLEARLMLQCLLASQPNNRYIHYELAKVGIAIQDFVAAEQHLKNVIRFKSDWAGAHMLMGVTLLSMGRLSESISAFQAAVGNWTGEKKQEYVKFFCSMCDEILDREVSPNKPKELLDVVEKICEIDEQINFPNSWNSLYMGCVEFCRGNFDASVAYFGRVAENGEFFLGRHASGSQGMRSLSHIESLHSAKFSPLAKFTWRNEPAKVTSRYVILISCDSQYFERFAPLAIKSIMRNTSAVVHLNIVDPSDNVSSMLEALGSRFPDRLFSSQQSFVGRNTRCFYACSRFFILPALMKKYKVPVLTVDVDSAFVEDLPSDMMERLDGTDFIYEGVKHARLSHFPWRSVAAGFALFNTSERAWLFANAWRDYLASVFIADADPDQHWYVDQSAMVSLLSAFEGKLTTFDIGNYTSRFCIFPDADLPPDLVRHRHRVQG